MRTHKVVTEGGEYAHEQPAHQRADRAANAAQQGRRKRQQAALRPVIVTRVALLGSTWPIELTLAYREEMGFRMLLGREAFRGRFLIDAEKSYYGGKPQRKKKPKQ